MRAESDRGCGAKERKFSLSEKHEHFQKWRGLPDSDVPGTATGEPKYIQVTYQARKAGGSLDADVHSAATSVPRVDVLGTGTRVYTLPLAFKVIKRALCAQSEYIN